MDHISSNKLFCSKQLDFYEYLCIEEMHALCSCLYALARKPIKVKKHLSSLTLSTMSRIVLGMKYFSELEYAMIKEFQEMLDELLLLNRVMDIGGWMHWLDFLHVQGYVK